MDPSQENNPQSSTVSPVNPQPQSTETVQPQVAPTSTAPPTTAPLPEVKAVNIPQPLGSSHRHRVWWIGLAVVFIMLLASGAYAYYAGYILKSKSVTTTKTHTGGGSNSSGSVKVTAPVTTTENCGSQDCFNQKFASCLPATLTASVAGLGATIKYQIIGKKSPGCSLTSEYTENPNSAWVNQPMTCTWDNTKDFQTELSAVFGAPSQYGCTGPLVAHLTTGQ